MRALLSVVALAAALVPVLARATDCDDAQTQTAMNACAWEAYGRADAKLNATHDTVMAHLEPYPGQTRRLMAAERAWVMFRDAECLFVAQPGPTAGRIAPMVEAQCRTKLTERRTADLQASLDCQEGASDCTLPQD